MSTISLFRNIESKHNVNRDKYCTKNFCESLREHALENINLKKKQQQESYENAKLKGKIIFSREKQKYILER